MQKIHHYAIWLSLFFGTLVLPCFALADAIGSLSTTPEQILMGAQYDGIRLKVNGTVPAGSEVVVLFTGAGSELHLREKGKVFGLLWMNVGKVTLKNVPKVCLIDSSRSFEELGKAAAPYRLNGLSDAIEIEKGSGGGDIDVARELLLLKKGEGLYSETAKGVILGPNEGASRTFAANMPIPSAIAPGEYQVEVVAIKDGAVVGRYVTAIKAELTGFPRWLSKLAYERSMLYGVLATVIALVSGLAIGLVFQSKGGH